MGVKLSWTNRGTDPLDAIRIYRSTTKTGALTLIDTIAGNALAYEDMTNPPSNTVLWYSVATVKGGNETLSRRTPIGNFADTGPGPKTLKMGDWEYGYFGEVTTDIALLPLFSEIQAAGVIAPQGSPTVTAVRKWVIGGKIIYIPNASYGSFSIAQALSSKIIKPFGNNAAPVTVVDKGDYGFKIRLPRSSSVLDLGDAVPLNGDVTKLKSELCALIQCNTTLDVAAENNRFFKGSGRYTDDTYYVYSSPRIFTGWADASNYYGLQWSQWSIPGTSANGTNVIMGNLIYELDLP